MATGGNVPCRKLQGAFILREQNGSPSESRRGKVFPDCEKTSVIYTAHDRGARAMQTPSDCPSIWYAANNVFVP